MCILCVIQKWSRRIATMLPWLVIPLIGLWALSQLLPPAFRFEITSPRLACVFVLLITLFWYEILMPQLSAWRVRRNARIRERKRFEAIEMQKLRKTATRRCRNCLTAYRDQNPGGGRFMCSYCGHISKRPVLDLPVPPGLGLPNSGIFKDLVGKSGKILNGKAWSDNSWMCGQDWLDNSSWVAGSFSGKPSYWRKSGGGGFFNRDDHCFAGNSYSCILIFAYRVLTAFFLTIVWLWRKIFRGSKSGDDASMDSENRGMLSKKGENGANLQESRGEKARRKAEEKRQARLEKEQLEEEERKQREEVARLVEERRRLRDEKAAPNKDRGKASPPAKEKDNKKDAEKKRQERKKERDRGSSKSNSDVEELEKRAGKEGERNRKNERDHREHYRTGAESAKPSNNEIGNGIRGASSNSYSRGNAGTRYLDRMRGTFLSSSRAFTGSSFFGKGAINSATITREPKSNGSADHVHTSANRREFSQPEPVSGKSNIAGDDKSIKSSVLSEQQPHSAPKKSWQQLFTRTATVDPPSSSTVISRPNRTSQSETQTTSSSASPAATHDNPINFGLPSPFPLSNLPHGSKSSTSIQLSSDSMFPRIGEAPSVCLPEESDKFEEPSYVPDPASLLGPVSESLDSLQLDLLGFVNDVGLEKPHPIKNIPSSSEVSRPSPIESPMSRLRVSEERNSGSFVFPSTPKAQDVRNLPVDESSNGNELGTWQMWNTPPLGLENLGLMGGTASWFSPTEVRSNKESYVDPMPQKTMASLFKKDDQALSGPPSPQNVFFGTYPNGETWLPEVLFGTTSVRENQFPVHAKEENIQNELLYGNLNGCASNYPLELSPTNLWPKKERTVQGSGESIGNSSITSPPVGGLFSSPNVQSLWSYD